MGKCMYPLWGDTLPPREKLLDGSAYCGKDTVEGSSYCEEHHARCWVKPTDAKDVKAVNWDFKPAEKAPAMANEHAIMNRCLVALSKLNVRVWRNNTGKAWTGSTIINLTRGQTVRAESGDVIIKRARPIGFGVPGSADILGLQAVTITQDMVGQTLGRFIAIEVKGPKGRQSPQQQRFEAMIKGLGGVYILTTDPDQAVTMLERETP